MQFKPRVIMCDKQYACRLVTTSLGESVVECLTQDCLGNEKWDTLVQLPRECNFISREYDQVVAAKTNLETVLIETQWGRDGDRCPSCGSSPETGHDRKCSIYNLIPN